MSKVFLITGSARGLGRDITEAALSAGHSVLATARTPSQLDDLVTKYGDQIKPFALDVTDGAAAIDAVQTAVATFGGLDVVVNNAGYANVASVEDFSLEDFRQQVDTNLFGVVNVTKAALPVLREQGSGHIIQVSSVGGRVASPGLSAYQSAKWAVGGFSSVLALEVAPLGIRVTVLEPGGMTTDWAGSSMTVHPVSAPYEATVGFSVSRLQQLDQGVDKAAGDPAKVAQVILRIADMDEPPVRLLLGSDALLYAGMVEKTQQESDARWHELSVSTDHDGVTAQSIDPLGARETG
jgi:NAD(P)-dependent dehydrogenase (short-subunit alcohol dehydrogenase family)